MVYGIYKKEDATLHTEELWGFWCANPQTENIFVDSEFYLINGRAPESIRRTYIHALDKGREFVAMSVEEYFKLHDLRKAWGEKSRDAFYEDVQNIVSLLPNLEDEKH